VQCNNEQEILVVVTTMVVLCVSVTIPLATVHAQYNKKHNFCWILLLLLNKS